MALAWITPDVEASVEVAFDTVATPAASTSRPWVLFVGVDDGGLHRAAQQELSKASVVIAPPPKPHLPVAAHLLPPPGLSSARTLYLPELDRGLFDGIGCAGTSLYLLPKITALASEGEPLAVVATARDEGADELVSQRGLASRFEIRRVLGDAAAPRERAALDDDDPTSALGTLFRGVALVSERRLDAAIATFRKSLEIDPALPAARYELGKALVQADAIEGAIEAFRETTELLPEFSSAWANLGAALGESRELDAAVDALERAVALDPLSHALHSNLGVAYRDQGRLDDAARELATALDLSPEFVFGHYNIASVHYLAGHYRDAIEAFETARTLAPKRSPRQDLMLAVTRLAAGDVDGALRDYRDAFGRAEAVMKRELRRMAEWDLKELTRRSRITPGVRKAAALVRSLE